MKKQFLSTLSVCGFSVITSHAVWAAPTTIASAPVAPVGTSQASASVFLPFVARVGDVAPLFNLPDSQGHSYGSRQQLGQRSLTLLLVGRNVTSAPVTSPAWPNYQEAIRALSRAASQRAEDDLATAVIFTNPQLLQTVAHDIGVLPNATALLDEKQTLQTVFGGSDDELTLVRIDRAGWVRGIETVADFASLESKMVPLVDFTSGVEVGKPAPNFSIQDTRGRWHQLAELRGRKNLLLTFFPKCFTGNCANHLSSIRDVQAQFDAQDTEVLAVSVDPAAGEHGQIAFAHKLGLKFPLIPDVNRNLSILYGAAYSPEQLASRMSFFVDKEGIVRWIDRQINVKTHGADVLAKMQQMKRDALPAS